MTSLFKDRSLRRLRVIANSAHQADQLKFIGWGLIGEPRRGVLISTPAGEGLDVSGYHVDDYWDGNRFLGADEFGIVPVYRMADGSQFPADAKQYPYLA